METFEGTVRDIDVIATPGLPVRCLAILSASPTNEIQVTTELQQLQSALEAASTKQVKVEASFNQSGPEKKLVRVRLLDS